jgi:hypothetical protein
MGGACIHAAEDPDGAGMGQQPLGKGGFSCVNMGKNTDISDWLHSVIPHWKDYLFS